MFEDDERSDGIFGDELVDECFVYGYDVIE